MIPAPSPVSLRRSPRQKTDIDYTAVKIQYPVETKKGKANSQGGGEAAQQEELQDVAGITLDTLKFQLKRLKAENPPPLLNTLEEKSPEKAGVQSGVQASLRRGIEGPVSLQDTLTEYEKDRLENVRRNQLFLENLGIYNTKQSLEVRPQKKPWTMQVHPPLKPVRRSVRLKVPSRKSEDLDEASSGRNTIDMLGEVDEVERCVDNLSFKRYICAAGGSSCRYDDPCLVTWSAVVGFRTFLKPLVDQSLESISTMDVATFGDARKGLIAAGDYGGRIAIFSLRSSTRSSESVSAISTRSSSLTVEEDREQRSLFSWKAGNESSEMQFLSQQYQDTTYLLSSSWDGSLVLWDLKVQGHSNQAHYSIPYAKAEQRSLHSKAIVGMHELDGHIATVSIDSSLVISLITESAIAKHRTIRGHHHISAIKGVRFREGNILADCGTDRNICILDLRLPTPCVSTIKTTYTHSVNVVEWCPGHDSLLLSASKCEKMFIHDIRIPMHHFVPLMAISSQSPVMDDTDQLSWAMEAWLLRPGGARRC